MTGPQLPTIWEAHCRKRDVAWSSGYLNAVTRQYPLLPLATLRGAATEQRSRELAAAESARARSERDWARSRELAQRAQGELARADQTARQRLEAGLERAFDLARASDERRGQLAALAELERETERLKGEFERAAERCAQARQALAHAEAEERAVERHRTTWLREQELGRAERADDEASERWSSERARRSGPH